MANILDTINQTKQAEITDAKIKLSQLELQEIALATATPRNFCKRIQDHSGTAIIAEIKKASPSKGLIRADFNPINIAKAYEAAGATCLSILTDRQYFQGHPDFIQLVKEQCTLPILRKDFIIDEYQIYESRVIGADAILLIAASLTQLQLESFEKIALDLGLSVLIEVHNETELEKIKNLKSPLIGVNNRNLKTFEVNLSQVLNLKPYVDKQKIIVCESGIHSHEDIKKMLNNDIRVFLIGESLMRKDNIENALFHLING